MDGRIHALIGTTEPSTRTKLSTELAVSSCARCSIHCREASPLRLGQFKDAWSHARSDPFRFTVNVHERVHLLADVEVSCVFSELRSCYEKRSARPTC